MTTRLIFYSALLGILFVVSTPRNVMADTVQYSTQAYQGEFVWVKGVWPDLASDARVSLTFDRKEVPCHRQDTGVWNCYEAVSPESKPGLRKMLVKVNGKKHETHIVKIARRKFPTLPLTLTDDKKALLTAENRAEEVQKIRAALQTESPDCLWKVGFVMPVIGPIESRFGEKRLVGGKLRKGFHRGLDIRAAEGTLVSSPSEGTVILAGLFIEEGGMVMLDHGHGLVTAYLHLSEITAHTGARLKKGDTVGKSGSTGVSNTQHLHWGIYLHGIPVDPESFASSSFFNVE